MFLEKHANPSRKWRDRSRGKPNTVSTFRSRSLAADRCASFQEIDGQIKNGRRKCFYLAMMICCCKQMWVLQTNWWTGQEPKEKMFLFWDDDLLLQTDVSPSNKLMDRWRMERENVSNLRWWSVGADGSPSFKEIDGKVENRRRKCFYFVMMICWCWWISVLQGHLRTVQEMK